MNRSGLLLFLSLLLNACTLKPAELGKKVGSSGLGAVESNADLGNTVVDDSTVDLPRSTNGTSNSTASTSTSTSNNNSTTTTNSSSLTGTLKISITESTGASSSKTINGTYATYNAGDATSYYRTVVASSTSSLTKAQIIQQKDCPLDCTKSENSGKADCLCYSNPNHSSCQVPECTLGSITVYFSLCATAKISEVGAGTYTYCVAATPEAGNVVEYESNELNQASGEYPNMGYELPYTSYPVVHRCERRSGESKNSMRAYTAAAENPKNGHYGSLDLIKFDTVTPNNSIDRLVSFKLMNGKFVEIGGSASFRANLDGTNIQIFNIPACRPRS